MSKQSTPTALSIDELLCRNEDKQELPQKSKVVSSIITSLQKQLLGITTMEDAQEIMQRLNALNELRKEIYDKYMRTV